MKKLVLALSAIAAFTGSAIAADLPARTYSKAPEVAPVASWTGFYLFGGGGGGVWDAKSNTTSVTSLASVPVINLVSRDTKVGGDGFFGTVGAGYDWQVNNSWVFGILADGQFGNLGGSLSDPIFGSEGTERLRTSWAAGVRLGYLVAPSVNSYINAGYTGSQWSGTSLTAIVPGFGATSSTQSFTRNGWFIGGGVENSLNFFGISAPGWFVKTEYRSAFYDRATLPEPTIVVPPIAVTNAVTFKPIVQTVSTSLVYRFNWTGPVVAKY